MRGRVALYANDIVVLKNVPVPSAFSQLLLLESLLEVSRDLETFALIVDVRESSRPSAEVREQIKRGMESIMPRWRPHEPEKLSFRLAQ